MHWNIDPVIFEIGGFGLRYYPLMFFIGFFTMEKVIARIFKAKGKDPKLVSTGLTYVILGTIIGARLGHCLFYDPMYYLKNPLEILMTWKGGLASHGGFLGVFIAIYLFVKKYKDQLSYLWLMDVLTAPCLFVGSLIRMGNFFNSEIVGKTTDVPWAIIFDRVDPFPRHPAQLYEAIGYFTLSMIMFYLYKKFSDQWKSGKIWGVGMILAFTFRFLAEFTKDNQSAVTEGLPINMGQVLSLICVCFGVYLFLSKKSQFNNL